mgnify:CR=1 FL=1
MIFFIGAFKGILWFSLLFSLTVIVSDLVSILGLSNE